MRAYPLNGRLQIYNRYTRNWVLNTAANQRSLHRQQRGHEPDEDFVPDSQQPCFKLRTRRRRGHLRARRRAAKVWPPGPRYADGPAGSGARRVVRRGRRGAARFL